MKKIFANDRLRISITDSCNFQCKYCTNEGQIHNSGKFISLNFIKQLAKFINKNQLYIKKLNITGGEPLLHPKLLEIVEVFKSVVSSITLNTNGELLNKNKIKDLKNAGVACIKFGIDSFFQKTTKPFWKYCICHPKKIINNLFYAKEIMPRSSVNIVLTDFNIHEFEDILVFCILKKIDLVEFLELINFDFRRNGQSLLSGISFSSIFKNHSSCFNEIKYNIRIGKYLCNINNGLTVQFADDYCKSRVCKNLWTRIDSSGSLIPCIKSKEKIKINFNQLLEQIEINNNLMCDGPISKIIPRSYTGELLLNNIAGEYSPSYIDILHNNNVIQVADLDP